MPRSEPGAGAHGAPAPRWFLSHPLAGSTPTWRDNPPVSMTSYSSIDAGDVCNQTIVQTLNHNGTHVDASFHFDNDGRRITDYALASWVFERPLLVDLPKGDDELITAADLEPSREHGTAADLLLIRTGFESHRADPERFGSRAPGFAADAAAELRRRPGLRAVGMDIPSAAAPGHLDAGVAFHQEILADAAAPSGTRGILLIEDMHLEQDLDGLGWVLVAPLRLLDGDGAPVTAFAG